MKMSTIVSIVTPSYKQGKFIEQTIRSIRMQSYRPLEHIVVDGGSADGTVEILKKYALDSIGINFKWVSEPDRGHPHAMNKGFAMAQGDIIGWLNSDDVYFDRSTVDRVVAEFTRHPEVDVIHGDVAIISEHSGIELFWCLPPYNFTRMLISGRVSQPTVFMRRSVIEQFKLDERLLALDFEYWLRVGKTCRFRHINRILACDRDHPNRASQVQSNRLRETHEQILKMYWQKPDSIYFYYKSIDIPSRVYYRAKGLCFLLAYMANSKRQEEIAFNGWIDSLARIIYRQLTWRIGRHLDMGEPPQQNLSKFENQTHNKSRI
jgi:glycosyltransferase involved in cell wall biosynthesis